MRVTSTKASCALLLAWSLSVITFLWLLHRGLDLVPALTAVEVELPLLTVALLNLGAWVRDGLGSLLVGALLVLPATPLFFGGRRAARLVGAGLVVCGVLVCALAWFGIARQEQLLRGLFDDDAPPAPVATVEPLPWGRPRGAVSAVPAGTFGWSIPTRVRVTETVSERGHVCTLRYVLELAPGADGAAESLVRFRDFECLAVDGRPPEESVVDAPGAAGALEDAASIPDLRIGADGAYVGTAGLDRLVERVCALRAAMRPTSVAEQQELRRTLSSPAFREQMETGMAKYWNVWVGAWLGWDVPAGERHETETELPVQGVAVPARLVFENHGAVPGLEPRHVHLSRVLDARGAGAASAMDEVARALGPSAPAGETAPREPFAEVGFTVRVEAILQLEGLFPVWARLEERSTMRERGGRGDAVEDVRTREYSFDW